MAKAPRTRVEMTQPPQDLVRCHSARKYLERPGVCSQRIAHPVSEQIAQGQLPRDPGIAQLEPGQVLDNPVVPGNFSLAHQQANGGCRERFAD